MPLEAPNDWLAEDTEVPDELQQFLEQDITISSAELQIPPQIVQELAKSTPKPFKNIPDKLKDIYGNKETVNMLKKQTNKEIFYYKKDPNWTILPDQYVGIEFEYEKWPIGHGFSLTNFMIHEDGSLKDRGIEIVTTPIPASTVESHLQTFFSMLPKEAEATPRCSTHFHIDFSENTLEEVYKTLLTYVTVEDLLFSLTKTKRKNSIFCVPLSGSILIKEIHKIPDSTAVFGIWHKYCSLNLKRLADLGTIEFRHFEGSKNLGQIMNWLRCILKIKDFALRHTSKELKEKIYLLNTNSCYKAYIKEIFGDDAYLFESIEVKKPLEKSILFLKMSDINYKNQKLLNTILKETFPPKV